MPGPRNGVRIKSVDGKPLLTGRKVSLSTPDEIARLGAKEKPARKRRMQMPTKLWLKPTPMVKSVPSSVKTMKTG